MVIVIHWQIDVGRVKLGWSGYIVEDSPRRNTKCGRPSLLSREVRASDLMRLHGQHVVRVEERSIWPSMGLEVVPDPSHLDAQVSGVLYCTACEDKVGIGIPGCRCDVLLPDYHVLTQSLGCQAPAEARHLNTAAWTLLETAIECDRIDVGREYAEATSGRRKDELSISATDNRDYRASSAHPVNSVQQPIELTRRLAPETWWRLSASVGRRHTNPLSTGP